MNKQGPGKIDWCDSSWNPVSGCWGPGGTEELPRRCFFCYAEAGYGRFGRSFTPTFHPERLEQPLRVKAPSKIFVCSVSDLFGGWVPREWIEQVLEIVNKAPWHTFQFLTKNPRRLAEFNPWPENAWVGATATDQASYDLAVRALKDVQANVRFLSLEPLLGPIKDVQANVLNWVIVGALTGRYAKAHPVDELRILRLEEALVQASPLGWKFPVFEKDSLAAIMGRPLRKEWPNVRLVDFRPNL